MVFGYDFFISYSWSDGASYAAALARQLRARGFEVFFDRDDYASGDDWKTVGAWKLRRTGQLVLIGSPAALVSAPVMREIQIFSATGRRIVPIDFGGTLDWKVAEAPLAQYLPAEILRIREPAAALQSGPSDQVAATIRRSFNLVRQDKKRVNVLAGIAAAMLALAIVAAGLGLWAKWERDAAVEEQHRAQRMLGQITATSNARVLALAERAEAERDIATPARLSDAAAQAERAASLIQSSQTYFDRFDYAGALKAAQAAIALLGPSSDAAPDRGDRRLSADAYQRLGLAEWQRGKAEDATQHLATSLDLIRALADEQPQDPALRERLAVALVDMGQILAATGKVNEADRDFAQAVALRAAAPDIETSPRSRSLLAVTYNRLASFQLDRKRQADAMESSGLAISILENLRSQTPQGEDQLLRDRARRELSVAYHIRARVMEESGDRELALTWRDKQVAFLAGLVRGDPTNIEWQHDLALSLEARGQLLEKLQRDGAALEDYVSAIAAIEKLQAQDGVPPQWLRDAARIVELCGAALTRLGRGAEAIDTFRRKAELLEQIVSSSLAIVSDRDLDGAYQEARKKLLAAGRTREALETAEQQLFAVSIATGRESNDLKRLAQVLSGVCWTALFDRQFARARLAARQAVDLDPNNAGALLNYAHALMYSDDLDAARAIYFEGLKAGGTGAAKWRKDIVDDFRNLSAGNLRHPLMAEIERSMAQ